MLRPFSLLPWGLSAGAIVLYLFFATLCIMTKFTLLCTAFPWYCLQVYKLCFSPFFADYVRNLFGGWSGQPFYQSLECFCCVVTGLHTIWPIGEMFCNDLLVPVSMVGVRCRSWFEIQKQQMCSNYVFSEVLVEISLSRAWPWSVLIWLSLLTTTSTLGSPWYFLFLFTVHLSGLHFGRDNCSIFRYHGGYWIINQKALVLFRLLQDDHHALIFILWDSSICCFQLWCGYAWHHFLVHMWKCWHCIICKSKGCVIIH